jgi:hypothetical protein
LNITTVDGKIYNKVNHITVNSDTISFLYEDGGATLNLAVLPPDLQKRFNYNPQAIADRELAEEKAKADEAAAEKHALDARQATVDSDVKNYMQLSPNSPSLTGQVFIVTKGGENFKLGGVRVCLFTMSQIEMAMAPKKEEAAKQLPVIVDQIKEAKRQYAIADAANANGDAIVENGEYFDAGKRMTDLQNSILTLETNASIYTSPDYYFAALPAYVAETTTDADGKFSFAVPEGRYVLAAKGSRDTLDSTEHYYWMIHFDMGNLTRGIQLSNDNLTSSDSDDSVINTSDPDAPSP